MYNLQHIKQGLTRDFWQFYIGGTIQHYIVQYKCYSWYVGFYALWVIMEDIIIVTPLWLILNFNKKYAYRRSWEPFIICVTSQLTNNFTEAYLLYILKCWSPNFFSLKVWHLSMSYIFHLVSFIKKNYCFFYFLLVLAHVPPEGYVPSFLSYIVTSFSHLQS